MVPALKLEYSFVFAGILICRYFAGAPVALERATLELVRMCLHYHCLQDSRDSGLKKQSASFCDILLFLCFKFEGKIFLFLFIFFLSYLPVAVSLKNTVVSKSKIAVFIIYLISCTCIPVLMLFLF